MIEYFLSGIIVLHIMIRYIIYLIILFLRINFVALDNNNKKKSNKMRKFADLSCIHATNKPVLCIRIYLLPIHSIAHFNRIDREFYPRSLIRS